MKSNELKTLFIQAYLSSLTLDESIKKKDISSFWIDEIVHESKNDLILLLKFMNKNKRFLTAKQGKKLFIKTLVNGYKTQTSFYTLLSDLKLADILSCTSFTKLEILKILKDKIARVTMDCGEFSSAYPKYVSLFRKSNLYPTLSFCNLMTYIKIKLFPMSVDQEIFVSFCEMHVNNSVTELNISYSTCCYNTFEIMVQTLFSEKEFIIHFENVIKIFIKFMFKFLCESEIIEILAKMPYLSISSLIVELETKPKICILYLKVLLDSEPELSSKILYRLTCLDKKLNTDIKFLNDIETCEKHVEIMDKETLKVIYEKISQLKLFLKTNYPYWDVYGLSIEFVDWNIPTLTYVSQLEMQKTLKYSYCNKLHLSRQGYLEFYQIDQYWLNKGVKKFKYKLFDTELTTIKLVSDPNIKFILGNEKLGSYWGYMCLDEYKEDCNKAKGCNLSLSLEINQQNREKIAKCALKRDIYQSGSTSKYDVVIEKKHIQQIGEKYDQLLQCNDIIFDQTFIYI